MMHFVFSALDGVDARSPVISTSYTFAQYDRKIATIVGAADPPDRAGMTHTMKRLGPMPSVPAQA
ncbi:hypothetical protein [Variovorax sp. dw_308]|uniref:hypothetical protein n=1 Tax=Variovorax sp. dw_308 TaxID=2721546 RepID=UPI001C4663B7|nr:hypothetical protein [Variovorax sp. dw_308]